MTPYVRRFIPENEIALFEKIRFAVIVMPDVDLGIDEKGEKIILSCHMLARAVAKVFSLKYVDGYYCRGNEHSWIVTPSGNIIDTYPIAVLGGPIMMDGNGGLIARQLYLSVSTRTLSRGRFGKKSFRRSVAMITATLQKELDDMM